MHHKLTHTTPKQVKITIQHIKSSCLFLQNITCVQSIIKYGKMYSCILALKRHCKVNTLSHKQVNISYKNAKMRYIV